MTKRLESSLCDVTRDAPCKRKFPKAQSILGTGTTFNRVKCTVLYSLSSYDLEIMISGIYNMLLVEGPVEAGTHVTVAIRILLW